jgi:peptidoglycan/LPS O-acetylase OafA/YrhL
LTSTAFGPLTNGFPGWRVAVPVIGAGMIIAGGTVVPRWGLESVIGTAPFRWLGKRSYSLYLWHWPLLVVFSQAAGSASFWKVKAPAFVLSVVLTVVTYQYYENPLRHRVLPSKQTVGLGLGASAATILVLTLVVVTTR